MALNSHQPASNYTFGLVAISEVNIFLMLLAQTFVLFSLYPIVFGARQDTFQV